jgi:hypothetical protein
MTESLLNLTGRLVNFDIQIQSYQKKAEEIASSNGNDQKERFNVLKSEYNQLKMDKKILKRDVQAIGNSLNDTFEAALKKTFDNIKVAYRNVKEEFDKTYTNYEPTRELHGLFNRYLRATTLKNEEGLKEMDNIKILNRHILSKNRSEDADPLYPLELDKAVHLHNSIKNYQSIVVGKQLRELYRLVDICSDHPEREEEFEERMDAIFWKELSACRLGTKVQREIAENARDEALREWIVDVDDLDEQHLGSYERIPVFNDLVNLYQILGRHRLLNYYSDLPFLKSEILGILSLDLSEEDREARINKARGDLREGVKDALDGKVYELSTDPEKGGEDWGNKNAAKDPKLLLQAIDELDELSE